MSLDEIKELAGHRYVSPWVIKLVLEAVELEREACAKACEEMLGRHNVHSNFICAAAIRARGE